MTSYFATALSISGAGNATSPRFDSCATPDHPMIDHVWRERLALSDRLIALRRSAMPFALTCWIETLRRSAIAAAKALRDIRGR